MAKKKVHMRAKDSKSVCGGNRGFNHKNAIELTKDENAVTCQTCKNAKWNDGGYKR